ncbi:MAG TPA: glycoside hydrolase family 97 protein [Vicinamibacteria bacterium]|nr:glycoside hydrolase family 97 protein [Vicinamibacteria bacterium]
MRLACCLVGCLLLARTALAEPSVLKSPNGKVEVSFSLGPQGAPLYSVTFAGRAVVADSPLGLTLRQTGPLSSGFRVKEVTRARRDERYPLVAGKTREGWDRGEEMTVALERGGDHPVRLDLVFRAYDDGAAFRYRLPQQAGLEHVDVVSEDSRFRFLADHRAWALFLASFTTSNEREFVPVPLLAVKPESIVGPPLLVEAGDGMVVALAEANLRHWSGLHFARVEGGADSLHPTLVTKLAPLPGQADLVVRGTTPMVSPWRVLMLGSRPGELIESTILTRLADPNEIGDTSWIRPGKVAWDWWNGPAIPGANFKVGMNDETFRYFIDFAAEFGLEYVLIDAGWYGDFREGEPDITRPIPGMDIASLVAYAKPKNVRLLLWLHWEATRNQMDAAFPLYEKWGIAGVKVDYMDRKDQEMVAFYQRTLRTAARYHLTVDFHGAYAGSGEERTFPNLLTREGVMGLEYSKWSDRVTPRHAVTLAFTRMLVGPMDFTPGGFRNVTPAEFAPRNLLPVVMGTRAHQLGLYVVFDSPLQMLSDSPVAYRGQPGAEFLKAVPASWDETRVLDGRIGEYVVIARRRGGDWFIGAITDAPRRLSVPLAFLGPGSFEATVYADVPASAQAPAELGVTPKKVSASGPAATLTLDLVQGGGAAIQLRPAAGAASR